MREIKFRAWNKDWEQMEDNDICQLYVGLDGEIMATDGDNEWRSLKNIVLSQYTGLKDKNGVEIYDGDALRDSESIVIVKFAGGRFSVVYRTTGGKWRTYGSLFEYLKDYEGEVIGNVYQNKDLMECEEE